MKYDNYSQYKNEYDESEKKEEFNIQHNMDIFDEIERVKRKMDKVSIHEFRNIILQRWGIATPLDHAFYSEYLCSDKEVEQFITDLRFDCF
jgi:hypothetical protein